MIKKSLYLSLLMLNASSLSHAWTPDEEALFINECGEVPFNRMYDTARSEYNLNVGVNNTPAYEQPARPIGTVRPTIRCQLRNQEEIFVALPGLFNLQAALHWVRIPNDNLQEDRLELSIGFYLNDQWQEVYAVRRDIPHHPDMNPDLPLVGPLVCRYLGDNHFLGQEQRPQRFHRPGGLGHYDQFQRNNDPLYPPGHQERPIYVEVFTLQGNVDRKAPQGEYRFERTPQQVVPNREEGRLLYSDGGGSYFRPRTTQDHWRLINGDNLNVPDPDRIFFVASSDPTKEVRFVEDVFLPEAFMIRPNRQGFGYLPEGLYQLLESGVDPQNGTRRLERWRRMEAAQENNEDNEFDITFPGRYLSSIPGMGGSAPRIIPALRGNGLGDIREEIARISQEVERQRNAYPNAQQQVIFLGNTGVGKSTLLSGLFRDLVPEQGNMGFRLVCDPPLENINIGAGFGVGTLIPTAYYDDNTQTLYWDSTGFQDARGEARDIINAFAIRTIFETCRNKPSKIVFVEEAENLPHRDHTAFYNKLTLLRGLFPDQDNFIQSLLFVLNNKVRPMNMGGLLQEIIDAGVENRIQLTPPVVEALTFLTNNVEERTLFINAPVDRYYVFDRDALADRINNLPDVPNLRLDLDPLVRGAGLHVGNLVLELDRHITHFINSEVTQNILHGCRRKIEAHTGTVAALRDSFREVLERLRGLQNAANRGVFLNQLERLFGQENVAISTTDLRRLLSQVDFLNEIGGHIPNNFAAWTHTLLGNTQDKIQFLCQPPEHIVTPGPAAGEGNMSTFQGPFMGVSDLIDICTAQENLTSVQIFAGCKFFFDGDLTLHGKNISIVSPMAHISRACKVDLSGLAGASGANGTFPGADGQPGQPGENGGNFALFCNEVTGNPQNMTIILNGGNGGNGGNGAQGADGQDGQVFNAAVVPRRSRIFNMRLASYANPLAGWFYRVSGTRGRNGGHGGIAGSHGLGGHPGLFIGDYLQDKILQRIEGSNGNKGRAGGGGRGGLRGDYRFCVASLSVGVEASNDFTEGCPIYYLEDNIQLVDGNHQRLIYIHRNDVSAQRQNLPPRQRAADGQPGQGVNGTPQAPVPQRPLDRRALQQAFNAYYFGVGQNNKHENATPFLGFIPSFDSNNNNQQ